MKTTNNVQKTENRESGKSAIAILAIAMGFVVISLSTNAREIKKHWQLNNSPAQITAMAIPASHASDVRNASNASNAFIVETSIEMELEIESWMTNENNFALQMASLEVEVEEALGVEEWMVDNQNFLDLSITTDKDKALEVENWMLDESKWAINNNL